MERDNINGDEILKKSCPVQKNGTGIAQKSISFMLVPKWYFTEIELIDATMLNQQNSAQQKLGHTT